MPAPSKEETEFLVNLGLELVNQEEGSFRPRGAPEGCVMLWLRGRGRTLRVRVSRRPPAEIVGELGPPKAGKNPRTGRPGGFPDRHGRNTLNHLEWKIDGVSPDALRRVLQWTAEDPAWQR